MLCMGIKKKKKKKIKNRKQVQGAGKSDKYYETCLTFSIRNIQLYSPLTEVVFYLLPILTIIFSKWDARDVLRCKKDRIFRQAV